MPMLIETQSVGTCSRNCVSAWPLESASRTKLQRIKRLKLLHEEKNVPGFVVQRIPLFLFLYHTTKGILSCLLHYEKTRHDKLQHQVGPCIYNKDSTTGKK